MEISEVNLFVEKNGLNSSLIDIPMMETTQTSSEAKTENRAAQRMMKHAVATQPNIQLLETRLKSGNLSESLSAKEVKGEDLLHQAIIENSSVVVQFLISHGVDLNALDRNGRTPLASAIENRYSHLVDMLINGKANLEIRREKDNFSPLEIAISMNDNYVASQLLNAGANPNSGRAGQPSLLAQALAKGLTMHSVAETLIQKGAEVNGDATKTSNPLYQAFSLPEPQRTQTIGILLSKGADINRRLENQTTVFCSYIENISQDSTSIELIRTLCNRGANVHAKDNLGKSAIEYAASKPQILAVLNEFRTDIAYLNQQLNLAVNQRNQALVQKWLSKGAQINNTDQNNQTALNKVVTAGDMTFAQFLVNNGAKIEQSNLPQLSEIIEKQIFTGQTLLDAAEFYLRNKAIAANSVDKAGRPLISVAVMVGNLALVQKLITFGATAEPEKKINGMTPLQLALKFKNEAIARVLIENGANVNAGSAENSVIMLTLNSSLHNLTQLLIEKKVQLNVGANAHYLQNPLSFATQHSFDLVKKFVENGADVNYKLNDLVPNVLFVAIWNGNVSTIEYLLQKGVRSDLKDSQGHSPMWHAIQNGRQDIVALLLKYGANHEDIG